MKNPLLRGDPLLRGEIRWNILSIGGNWDDIARDIRVSRRNWDRVTRRDNYLGFRLFRTKEKS